MLVALNTATDMYFWMLFSSKCLHTHPYSFLSNKQLFTFHAPYLLNGEPNILKVISAFNYGKPTNHVIYYYLFIIITGWAFSLN